ncbi:hypothetical protein PPTG_04122 [Phytophthora nicotianae INRA-310]|uniref:Uncharacterized protein n=2 Tax=Phytophthora nicotianae TaxID=4792 RepID=W2R1F8_PHYN3|nr:hypothetical protein PPTG_04122 [Phytophthora nicotianae INRA-310]ETN18544.1 hypothetical protein PPTG_04122 [Phytophthora nicotianae INRA-310]
MSAAIQLVEDVEDDQEKTVSTLDPRQLGQAASTEIMGWLRMNLLQMASAALAVGSESALLVVLEGKTRLTSTTTLHYPLVCNGDLLNGFADGM